MSEDQYEESLAYWRRLLKLQHPEQIEIQQIIARLEGKINTNMKGKESE